MSEFPLEISEILFLQELFTQMQICSFKKKPRTKYFHPASRALMHSHSPSIVNNLGDADTALIQTTFTTTTTKTFKKKAKGKKSRKKLHIVKLSSCICKIWETGNDCQKKISLMLWAEFWKKAENVKG